MKGRNRKVTRRRQLVLRYQGREGQSTIQAPTLKHLNRIIAGMRAYAREHNLGAVKVIKKWRTLPPSTGHREGRAALVSTGAMVNTPRQRRMTSRNSRLFR